MIKITAVQNIQESPERAALFGARVIVHFDIDVEGVAYPWQHYVPISEPMQYYLDAREAAIIADIQAKEAAWAASPKEKTIPDDMGNDIVVPVSKDEIVRPDIPDHVEKRKSMYPPVGEYLDAQVKKNSGDATLQAEGEAQEAAYIQACLDLKESAKRAPATAIKRSN